MTPIAPHVAAFLRDRLPRQRGASRQTCDTYAYGLKLLFQFASARLKVPPALKPGRFTVPDALLAMLTKPA